MFRFPLQRILDLKTKREEEVARELVVAQSVADESRRVRDSLAAAHENGRRQLASTTTPTVGELRSLSLVLGHMQEHVMAASEDTATADATAALVQVALTSALQERRVLGRLRGRRLEAHQAEESARDRQLMDAIALARFTRRDTRPGSGGVHS